MKNPPPSPPKKRVKQAEMVCNAIEKLATKPNAIQKTISDALAKLVKHADFLALEPRQKLKVKAQLGKDQEAALLFLSYDCDEISVFIADLLEL